MATINSDIRINHLLAERGITTRRQADEWLKQGRIKLSGQVAILGQKVRSGQKITINLSGWKQDKVYLLCHKALGQDSHPEDPNGAWLADSTKHLCRQKLFPVGRLDKDSQGLMLYTNDGRIVKNLLQPEADKEKEYLVETDKNINNFFLKQMARGVTIETGQTKPAQVKKINDRCFRLILNEGKKHQIRRMCAQLGYQVSKLQRVRIMNLRLGQLSPGTCRLLTTEEQTDLFTRLKIANSQTAGLTDKKIIELTV